MTTSEKIVLYAVAAWLLWPRRKAGIGKIYDTRHSNTRSCNDGKFTDTRGRGACSYHRGVMLRQPKRKREGVPYAQTPEIAPNRAIKANLGRAISEVLTLSKFRNIKPMEAQMVFSAFRNNPNGVARVSEGSLAAGIFHGASNDFTGRGRSMMIKKPILDYLGYNANAGAEEFELSRLGHELVTAIAARLESLLNAKRGTVLFNPDIRGI